MAGEASNNTPSKANHTIMANTQHDTNRNCEERTTLAKPLETPKSTTSTNGAKNAKTDTGTKTIHKQSNTNNQAEQILKDIFPAGAGTTPDKDKLNAYEKQLIGMTHLKTHNSTRPELNIETDKESHICPTCGKSPKQEADLNKHRSHKPLCSAEWNREKNTQYKCDIDTRNQQFITKKITAKTPRNPQSKEGKRNTIQS